MNPGLGCHRLRGITCGRALLAATSAGWGNGARHCHGRRTVGRPLLGSPLPARADPNVPASAAGHYERILLALLVRGSAMP